MERNNPNRFDDVIDSRDIREAVRRFDFGEADEDTFDIAADEKAEEPKLDEDERALLKLHREGEKTFGSVEWRDGVTLVRDSYFEDYAQEFAEDIGAVNRDAAWPNNHIDWSAAAEALRLDFINIDFDGVEYWGRA